MRGALQVFSLRQQADHKLLYLQASSDMTHRLPECIVAANDLDIQSSCTAARHHCCRSVIILAAGS